jgi:hypothetical protein
LTLLVQMLLVLAALIVAAAVVWGSRQVASEIRKAGEGAIGARTLQVLQTFATAAGEAARDPRAILIWEPLARTARQLLPDEFARLDRASGGSFPFNADRIEAAHAQWTADWLAWELTHDAEYKLKTWRALKDRASCAHGWTPSNAKSSICTSGDMRSTFASPRPFKRSRRDSSAILCDYVSLIGTFGLPGRPNSQLSWQFWSDLEISRPVSGRSVYQNGATDPLQSNRINIGNQAV